MLISIFSLSIKNANAEVINGILLTVNKELPIEVIVIEWMKRMFAIIKNNPPNKPHQDVLTIELKKYFLYLRIRIIVKDAIKPKPL